VFPNTDWLASIAIVVIVLTVSVSRFPEECLLSCGFAGVPVGMSNTRTGALITIIVFVVTCSFGRLCLGGCQILETVPTKVRNIKSDMMM